MAIWCSPSRLECRYRWLRLPATTFVITHSPSRSNRRDGLRFSGEGGGGRLSCHGYARGQQSALARHFAIIRNKTANLVQQNQPHRLPASSRFDHNALLELLAVMRSASDATATVLRDSYLVFFSASKILPFIRRAISVAGSGFWHSDRGLSQKLESGNISNRLRATAPRQVSGSFT